MTKVRQSLGKWGERLAAAHLVENGMVLVDRNWRTATGEIDIIARDGDAVVFCEQKLQDLRRVTRLLEAHSAPTAANHSRMSDERGAESTQPIKGQVRVPSGPLKYMNMFLNWENAVRETNVDADFGHLQVVARAGLTGPGWAELGFRGSGSPTRHGDDLRCQNPNPAAGDQGVG